MPLTGQSQRVHSSHPEEYPVSGRKPLHLGLWSRTVIEERKMFIANTIEAIAEVFPDHELIRSLGCESVVNLPVAFADAVIGTVNLLDALWPLHARSHSQDRKPFALRRGRAPRRAGCRN